MKKVTVSAAKKKPRRLNSKHRRILGVLTNAWNRQKSEARYSKRAFRGGWTYFTTVTRWLPDVVRDDVEFLIDAGFVNACCSGHRGEFIEAICASDTGRELVIINKDA